MGTAGVEPSPFLLNRQAGYRLPDPGMKPAAGIAPASPAYDAGSLLLTYAGATRRVGLS